MQRKGTEFAFWGTAQSMAVDALAGNFLLDAPVFETLCGMANDQG
jgi:hypothetical protein